MKLLMMLLLKKPKLLKLTQNKFLNKRSILKHRSGGVLLFYDIFSGETL